MIRVRESGYTGRVILAIEKPLTNLFEEYIDMYNGNIEEARDKLLHDLKVLLSEISITSASRRANAYMRSLNKK